MLKYPKKDLLFAPPQGKKGVRTVPDTLYLVWRTDERVKAAKIISKCRFGNEVNTVKKAHLVRLTDSQEK